MGKNEKDLEEVLNLIQEKKDEIPVNLADCMLTEFTARIMARMLDVLEAMHADLKQIREETSNDWR